MKWMICATFLLAGCAKDYGVASTGPWTDFYNEPQNAAVPKDVRVFVIKAQGCGHFSGEEGYDAERAAFLKKNTDELCTGLPDKRKKLLAKYHDDAAVKTIIAEVWDAYGFD